MSHEMIDLPSLRVHYRAHGENGPAVVLLHGWPQTAACWHAIEPLLADDHRLIAPDLRGYGHSGKPPGDYSKRRMAADLIELLDALGIERAHLVGHDRGARVAHRFALDHPERLATLTVLDVSPTHAMFSGDMNTAQGYFHWLFHMQPDLPELLTAGREEEYLRYFFERWTFRRDRLEPMVPEYVRSFRQPGAMRAGFDDYRAMRQDLELDEADQRAGRRVGAPTLVLWGAAGLPASTSVLDVWRRYALRPEGRAIEDCGHFIAEEAPEELAAELRSFWERSSRLATTAEPS